MCTLYYIVSPKTTFFYIGMTGRPLSQRWSGHKHAAKAGIKYPIYDCIRKYGVSEFMIYEDCCQEEIRQIKLARDNNWKLLNLADGGEGGYVIPEASKEAWKAKLSKARQGAKPSLGMKHTEENKKFFAKCNERKVPTYPNLDFKLGYRENNNLYGISRTHYYRLLKRAKANDLS